MKYEIQSGPINVDVNLINADLKIIAEERSDIEVDCPGLRKNSMEEVYDISFENGILSVAQKSKKLSQFVSSGDMSVNISVPASVEIEGGISSISGEVKISGLCNLKSRIKTKSGDIVISDAAEINSYIESLSGDVDLKTFSGIITASTISGDIKASDAKLTDVSLKSISGDISLSSEFDLKNSGSINTVSGDISINFIKCSRESGFNIKTVSGEITLDGDKPDEEKIKISSVKGDLSGFKIGKEIFSGAFGSSFGNVMKNLKSHIKNVSSDKSDSNVTEEVGGAKKDGLSVQTILNMVSDGKITVDEAEKLIKALK